MVKAYSRINWENSPSEATPINEDNLNRIDAGLDETDNRIITLDTTKLDKVDAQMLVKQISYNQSNGVFTITYFNGTTFTIDTVLEKLAVNFDFDPIEQRLIIVLDDGTEKYVDLSALLTQYEFLDSETISFVLGEDGKVTAKVKEGSIEEKHLRPDYLAEIKVEAGKAQAASQEAAQSEIKAKASEEAAKGSEENAAQSAEDAAVSAEEATNKAAEAAASAEAAAASEAKAKASEEAAKASALEAAGSSEEASGKASEAAESSREAAESREAAREAKNDAETSANAAAFSAEASDRSASSAKASQDAAKISEINAAKSAQNAKTSETHAENSASAAAESAASALASKNAAESAQNAAAVSENNAANSSSAASTSATNAANSATAAERSAQNAEASANRVEEIETRLQGTLHAMGTITFANLPVLSEAHEGDMYNISDEFVTTEIFKDGAGKIVPAGSNVYKTADEYWDVLAGSLVSSVNGKTGNVEIDLDNIEGVLPISKGGTGGNTKKAVNDIVATGSGVSDPATFSENDRFLWVFNGSSVIKSKFVTLIKYIESKLASVASSGSYNDLTDKPTTMKNPKALNFTGGSFLLSYDGSVEKTINLPSTLPANGGTAQTISDTLPIEKGGTGQTTAKDALRALVEGTEDGTSTPTDNDWYLCQTYNGGANDQSVVRRKTISLWSYIKSKCDALFLKLSGGTMSGTINSSKSTGTYLAGNQGQAIINSTAGAGSYTMLDKLNSTNGFFTDGAYNGERLFQYTAKGTVNAGTNKVTKSVTLLDEAGNTKFPGTVTAPRFAGTTDEAVLALKVRTYLVGCSSRTAPTNPWYKFAECEITRTDTDPTCMLLIYDTFKAQSMTFWGLVQIHARTNNPIEIGTTDVHIQWIFKSSSIPGNLIGAKKVKTTNGIKITVYIQEPYNNYQSWAVTVLSNTVRTSDTHYWSFANNLKDNGDVSTVDLTSSGYGNIIASKLGTATVGAVSRPIYLNGGTPTPIGNSIGLVDGITSRDVISIYDDGDTANNGGNLLIRGGGNLFIGSGESPENLYTALKNGNIKFPDELWNNSGEECYITSDGNIYLYTKCQTITNRKGLRLHSPDIGYSDFSPLEDSDVDLGRSNKKFARIYANRLYGTATSATKLGTTGYIEENSRATTDEGIRIRPFRNALDALIMSIGNNGNSPSASNYEEIVAFTIGNNYLDSDARCFLQYSCFPNNSSVSDTLMIGRANSYVTRELTMGLVCEMVEARSHSNSSGWAPIYAASFDKVSSRKYKEDIEDINEDEANKVLDIRIVSFKYKDDKGKRKQFGCIAEEVVDVIESAVTYKNGEVNGVDYSSFVPHLIKMAQIQQKEINELKNEVGELRREKESSRLRLENLESQMEKVLTTLAINWYKPSKKL